MISIKYFFIFLLIFLNFGCKREIIRENQPTKNENAVTQIVKSDIDNVLEVHVNETRKLLKELMN